MKDFKSHHALLDERVIGYTACVCSTGNIVTFDSSVVVGADKAAMRHWLKEHQIHGAVTLDPIPYEGLTSCLHEDGMTFLLDAAGLSLFREHRARDLRFHPAVAFWESELGTLVEPEFNPYRDSVKLLSEQLGSAIVGYVIDDESERTDSSSWQVVFGIKSAAHSIPMTFEDHQQMLRCCRRFDCDEVADFRLKELQSLQEFCEEWR